MTRSRCCHEKTEDSNKPTTQDTPSTSLSSTFTLPCARQSILCTMMMVCYSNCEKRQETDQHGHIRIVLLYRQWATVPMIQGIVSPIRIYLDYCFCFIPTTNPGEIESPWPGPTRAPNEDNHCAVHAPCRCGALLVSKLDSVKRETDDATSLVWNWKMRLLRNATFCKMDPGLKVDVDV